MILSQQPQPSQAHDSALDEAFREVHGRRLHGFALLLTLGDRALAVRLTAEALAAAEPRLDELRHPERAAAWLRARVLTAARSHRAHGGGTSDRFVALEALGTDGAVLAGLRALNLTERAALITTSLERLDVRDVATILRMSAGTLERTLRRARLTYARAHAAASSARPAAGPLTDRIRRIAERAMA